MKTITGLIIALCLLFVPAAVFISCAKTGTDGKTAVEKQTQKYMCPMHPNYVSDKPGDCPICGMTLVPVKQKQSTASPQQQKKVMYRSTMKPGEVSDKPGKDSMGMEMEKFVVEQGSAAATPVAGLSAVTVTPEQRQLIGLKTEHAVRRDMTRSIATSGRVAYDPDLYYAEQEYLSSTKLFMQSKTSSQDAFPDNARSLRDASRLKLKLMGLSDVQIDALAKNGSPDTSLLLPQESKNIWIYAAIYADDIQYVKPGQTAVITVPSVMSGSIRGKIVAIDPVVDPSTRSARARITAENSGGILKPETYLNVTIQVPLGIQLVIPQDAVMDTGTRTVVFVDKGEGVLEPREVKVTYRTDEYAAIVSGLSEGDRVVTNANFLIDSESQLKASQQQSTKP